MVPVLYLGKPCAGRKAGCPKVIQSQVPSRISPPLPTQRPPAFVAFSSLGQNAKHKQFKGESVCLGSQSASIVHHGGEAMTAGMRSSQPQHRGEDWCSPHFLQCVYPGTPPHRDGAAHTHSGFFHFSPPYLDNPSRACLEVCLLGYFRSCQVRNNNYPSYPGSLAQCSRAPPQTLL